MGESGSAGTHSCFMGLFQEELLDLLVFTGIHFVSVCIFTLMCQAGCRSAFVWPCTALFLNRLPTYPVSL